MSIKSVITKTPANYLSAGASELQLLHNYNYFFLDFFTFFATFFFLAAHIFVPPFIYANIIHEETHLGKFIFAEICDQIIYFAFLTSGVWRMSFAISFDRPSLPSL